MTPVTKQVGTATYTIIPLDADKAIQVQTELFRLLAEPAGHGAAALLRATGDRDFSKVLDIDLATEEGRQQAIDFAGALLPGADSVIASLVARVDRNVAVWLVRTLLEGCTRQGRPITRESFAEDFRGNSGEMWRAAYAAIEVNFGPLAGGLFTGASGTIPESKPQA